MFREKLRSWIATKQKKWISAKQKRFFDEEGYIVLKGFFSAPEITKVKARVDELWAGRSDIDSVVIEAYIGGTEKKYRSSLFRYIENEARSFPYRINDIHLAEPVVQDIVADIRLVSVIKELLQSAPLVCNSLLSEHGSEDGAYFDTFYMPPKTPNMMAASWVAIDPVVETNGPLFFYPKSHKIEPYKFSNGTTVAIGSEMDAAIAHIERIVKENDLKKELFFADPGDVLIWHAQLLHGGSPIKNPHETRTSLETHYWTELDYPAESDRIVLGEGRYLLNKSHQQLPPETVEVDAFMKSLVVDPEQLRKMPPDFDPRGYLLKNRDVLRARFNPYAHYLMYGYREKRAW